MCAARLGDPLSNRPTGHPPPLLTWPACARATRGDSTQVLFGKVRFSGALSFGWPRSGDQATVVKRQRTALFPRGFGLKT